MEQESMVQRRGGTASRAEDFHHPDHYRQQLLVIATAHTLPPVFFTKKTNEATMKKMKQMFSGNSSTKKPKSKTKPSTSNSNSSNNNNGSKPSSKTEDRKQTSSKPTKPAANQASNSSSTPATEDPPVQTTTPRADVTLPERPLTDRRKQGSRQAQRDNAANHFPILPKLMSVPLKERPGLFVQKLAMCEQGFTFTGDVPDSVSKDMHTKRQTLLELVDYVNTAQQVAEVFTDDIQACVVRMVSANIFRSLPAMEHGYDAEQDEPTYEASWPHLQVVYEFLLRFVISNQVSSKHAKKHINHQFCCSLVELFDRWVDRSIVLTSLRTIVVSVGWGGGEGNPLCLGCVTDLCIFNFCCCPFVVVLKFQHFTVKIPENATI